MSVVTLVSGGLDSTVLAMLVKSENIEQYPLFIDYGQLNRDQELHACKKNFKKLDLPSPEVLNICGYGALLSSGITDPNRRIFEDAFLPARNLVFLTFGAAYAYQINASTVAIGLLDDSTSLFPDQTKEFITDCSVLLSKSLGRQIQITAPLITSTKSQVIHIAKEFGITDTYSCHAGSQTPCGVCVACREFNGMEA